MEQSAARILDSLLRILTTLVTVLLVACRSVGCATFHEGAGRPHSATIIRFLKQDGPEVIRVSKSSEISRLEEFFPRYRRIPANSNDSATWSVAYEIYFNFHGNSLYVITDGQRWSNDHGDFGVHGDLTGFVSALISSEAKEK